jgi:hypothetical protein
LLHGHLVETFGRQLVIAAVVGGVGQNRGAYAEPVLQFVVGLVALLDAQDLLLQRRIALLDAQDLSRARAWFFPPASGRSAIDPGEEFLKLGLSSP